jgi:hypothetical protein
MTVCPCLLILKAKVSCQACLAYNIQWVSSVNPRQLFHFALTAVLVILRIRLKLSKQAVLIVVTYAWSMLLDSVALVLSLIAYCRSLKTHVSGLAYCYIVHLCCCFPFQLLLFIFVVVVSTLSVLVFHSSAVIFFLPLCSKVV